MGRSSSKQGKDRTSEVKPSPVDMTTLAVLIILSASVVLGYYLSDQKTASSPDPNEGDRSSFNHVDAIIQRVDIDQWEAVPSLSRNHVGERSLDIVKSQRGGSTVLTAVVKDDLDIAKEEKLCIRYSSLKTKSGIECGRAPALSVKLPAGKSAYSATTLFFNSSDVVQAESKTLSFKLTVQGHASGVDFLKSNWTFVGLSFEEIEILNDDSWEFNFEKLGLMTNQDTYANWMNSRLRTTKMAPLMRGMLVEVLSWVSGELRAFGDGGREMTMQTLAIAQQRQRSMEGSLKWNPLRDCLDLFAGEGYYTLMKLQAGQTNVTAVESDPEQLRKMAIVTHGQPNLARILTTESWFNDKEFKMQEIGHMGMGLHNFQDPWPYLKKFLGDVAFAAVLDVKVSLQNEAEDYFEITETGSRFSAEFFKHQMKSIDPEWTVLYEFPIELLGNLPDDDLATKELPEVKHDLGFVRYVIVKPWEPTRPELLNYANTMKQRRNF